VALERRRTAQPKPSRRTRKMTQSNRVQRQEEDEADGDDDDGEEEDEKADEPEALDPALFAAAFARTGDAAARDVLTKHKVGRQPRKARSSESSIRLPGERTVLRTWNDEPEHEDLTDAPLQHTPLDPHRSMPSARERGYKKRKLGLRSKDVRANPIEKPRRPRRTKAKSKTTDPDDPLGLQDPAFMPGGEFFHLTGRPTSKRQRAGQRIRHDLAIRERGAGGRVQGTYAKWDDGQLPAAGVPTSDDTTTASYTVFFTLVGLPGSQPAFA